jgi:hypothetical protein
VKITKSCPEQSRRLASQSIGLDVTAKLVHRVPPPLFWMQNLCSLEVTDRVAL